MAFTVTATASGAGSNNGTMLSVLVVNNAALTQAGATVESATVTVPEASITPTAAGSLVYGAVLNGNATAAFGTPAGTTTELGDDYVSGTGTSFGTFKSSALTTTASTTYGWTAPTEAAGDIYIALAEITASGGTIAEDASSPALAFTSTAKTVTTASFTPPASSILVAVVAAGWTGSGAVSVALTDTSGGVYTWTQRSGTGTTDLASVWVGVPAIVLAPAQLAAGTGSAGSATLTVTPHPALAAGSATLPQLAAEVTPFTGLAPATGAAYAPSIYTTSVGLPSGSGKAGSAAVTVTAHAGLAAGTGAAHAADANPIAVAGLPSGTASAIQPSVTTVYALPGGGTGTAVAPSIALVVHAGLATGTGAALTVGELSKASAGLATATGSAAGAVMQLLAQPGLARGTGLGWRAVFPPSPQDFGGSFSTSTANATFTLPDYAAKLSLADYGGSLKGGTMQNASLTLSEFNDMIIDITVTDNGAPMNLTGYTLNLLLKSAAGVADSQALVFSSGGTNPAITVTNASSGLAVAELPNSDLDSESYAFYRLDVVNTSAQQQTVLYGSITWITL